MRRGMMYKIAGCGLGAMIVAGTAPSAGASILISQYYEGSTGSNRLIEIWNPTASEITFSAANPLAIEIYTNGSSSIGSTLTFNGTTGPTSIAPNGVIVIANTDATGDSAIAAAGLTVFDTTNGAINFNGDDALVVRLAGVITDSIGQVGLDPGTSWSANGVSTADQNIQLKFGLVTGDLDTASAYDPSVRYEFVTAANVSSGSFTGFGVAPVPEPTSVGAVAVAAIGLLASRRRARHA